MGRSRRAESRLETKTKTWLKRNDPNYVRKMQEINGTDEMKKKRNDQSKKRRAGHSATHAVFKKFGPLTDKQGNSYSWNDKYKKLTRNNSDVVRRARDGNIHYIPYDTEEDLDDDKYDDPIIPEVDKKLVENVEKLLNGDEQLDKVMKTRKFVVTKELSDTDCYWKQMSDKEKRMLLRKLRKNVMRKNKIVEE
jgi:hypothetical protein